MKSVIGHIERIKELAPHDTGYAAGGVVCPLTLNRLEQRQQFWVERFGFNLSSFDADSVFAPFKVHRFHGHVSLADASAGIQGNLELHQHPVRPFVVNQGIADIGNLFFGKLWPNRALSGLDAQAQKRVAGTKLAAHRLIQQEAHRVQIILGGVVLNRLASPTFHAPVKKFKGVVVAKLARMIDAALAHKHHQHIPTAAVAEKRGWGIYAVLTQEWHHPLLKGRASRDIGQCLFLGKLLMKQPVRSPLALPGAVADARAGALNAVNGFVFQIPERRIRPDIQSRHTGCAKVCVSDRGTQEQRRISTHNAAQVSRNGKESTKKSDIIRQAINGNTQQIDALCAFRASQQAA